MCSRAAPREAFTSTTSAAATFSRTHASASSRPAVGTASPVQPGTVGRAVGDAVRRQRRPRRRGRRPASAAARPTSRCASSASAPSSFISPSTATVRRERRRPIAVERLDRGRHGRGVGVVGVVDDDQPVGALVHLHPPARGRLGGAQPLGHAAGREARRDRHRGGRGGVEHLVGPDWVSRTRCHAPAYPSSKVGRPRSSSSRPRQVTSPAGAEREHAGVGAAPPSRRSGRRRR